MHLQPSPVDQVSWLRARSLTPQSHGSDSDSARSQLVLFRISLTSLSLHFLTCVMRIMRLLTGVNGMMFTEHFPGPGE